MKKSKNVKGLVFALVLCLIGAIFCNIFQSNFGKTEVKEFTIVSESGYELCMQAFIPENATKENPAPVVIMQHGGNDDKYLMSRFGIELARRGFVAVTGDMYSHGASEKLPDSEWLTAGRGMYDVVRNVVTWPFVDVDQVSVLGYSRGGKACGEMMNLDNETLNVIKNIYLLASDPIYRDEEGNFVDVYGDRNVRVLADYYDEFFFTEKADSSTYDNDKNRFMQTLTSPVDYIFNPSAQSFLYFGEDPTGKELRAGDTLYEKDYDGVTATREIDLIDQTHMLGHWSQNVLVKVCDFFTEVIPSPIGVNSGNGLVPYYEISAFIGAAGLILAVIYLAAVLIEKSNYFADVTSPLPSIVEVSDRKDKRWYWCMNLIAIVCNVFVIWGINKLQFSSWHDTIFRATYFVYLPILCLMGGICTLLITSASLRRRVKLGSADVDKERLVRILPGWKYIGKTAIIAFIVIVFYELVLFANKYFFGIIYKIPVWGLQPIYADRIKFAFLVLPMTTMFYVTSALSNDGFGYTSILGKRKGLNMFLTGIVTALPVLTVQIYVHTVFRITGWNPMFGGNAAAANSILRLPVIMMVMICITRSLYQKTGNVYLGGFISGLITAFFTASCSEIRLPEADEKFFVSVPLLLLIAIAVVIFIVCMKYYDKVRKELNLASAAKK